MDSVRDVIITRHAMHRAKQRVGLKPRSLRTMAERAWSVGLRHEETSGLLHAYLNRLYLSERTANNIRIYGEHVYLFCDAILITVIHVPSEYKRLVRTALGKRYAR